MLIACPARTISITFPHHARTAPPVAIPDTRHCSVHFVQNGSKNFYPYGSTSTPPADCRGLWSQVVLRMQGSVKGVQFDRLGHITIGGVGVFRTSTPEPSTDGSAFDIRPLTYDLTPFVGLLTDGKAHEVRVHVAGVPAGQSGWFTVPHLHVWTGGHAKQPRGAITSYAVGELSKSDQVSRSNDGPGSVRTTAHRTVEISGYLDTSAGRIRTTVERTLANTSDHTWADGESHDALDATWHDTAR
jgi:hypothetical protein